MRCIVCGRLPAEECCEICHRVERALEAERVQAMRERGLATYEANFGFGEEVTG